MHAVKDQELRNMQKPWTKSHGPRAIYNTIESPADAGTHAEPRTTSQATKGKDQEPKTKSHKDHIEPRSKGPRAKEQCIQHIAVSFERADFMY